MANPELVSDWYSPNRLTELLEFAEPGDLIEFHRGLYSHWAVYLGFRNINGRSVACVSHYASPGDTRSFDVVCRSNCCRKRANGLGNRNTDPLVDVALESKARINNGTDSDWVPGTRQEILHRAENCEEDDDDEEYDAFTNNCEHFAHLCRYGKKKSCQIQNVMTTGAAVLGAGLAVVGIAAVAAIFTSTGKSDNQKQKR